MLEKHYHPTEAEPRLSALWQQHGVYHFSPDKPGPVFSIDTPPPTVSGNLHLGHVYSYSHADFIARFRRMNGYQVYYPMGYDDNGLPTERLVEKRLGITAAQVGRAVFIEKCLQVSEEAEKDYQELWQRLGLSVDWRYTYRTIDELSRRTSQFSFIDLYRKGLAYRREAPAIWCPECRTSIAQAELNDLERQPTLQTVRVHERCDTPVETIIARQWFIRVLDFKEAFLKAGQEVEWRPEHMQARYRAWVENLNWDWCISRQRYFGVPFPLWYCAACGEIILADENQLPVDPVNQSPSHPCACGSTQFQPETDIMDTWATSSLSPQIAGQWLARSESQNGDSSSQLYPRVFPFSLRSQAHEIIRTWAFYTIVKSLHHFGQLPWKTVLISGWGLAGEGAGKISKSRGGGPMPPLEMIERYSADAVRYWAASTSPGKDAVISEEKIQLGARLVTKLWNVARFSEGVLQEYVPLTDMPDELLFTPADRWILARLNDLVQVVTKLLHQDEYAAAKSETENFFWGDLADNYMEMCKQRLYTPGHPQAPAARYTLYHVLLTMLKLFAPILPYVTEEIYQGLFTERIGSTADDTANPPSIHTSGWPSPNPAWSDPEALESGEILVQIATAVRRYKSERSLPLGSELPGLQMAVKDAGLAERMRAAIPDLLSVTRARQIQVVERLQAGTAPIQSAAAGVQIAILQSPLLNNSQLTIDTSAE